MLFGKEWGERQRLNRRGKPGGQETNEKQNHDKQRDINQGEKKHTQTCLGVKKGRYFVRSFYFWQQHWCIIPQGIVKSNDLI